jgi:uncharacterized protein YciI
MSSITVFVYDIDILNKLRTEDVFLCRGRMRDYNGKKDFAVSGENILFLDKEEVTALMELINFMDLNGGIGGVEVSKFEAFKKQNEKSLNRILDYIALVKQGDKLLW